MVQIKKRKIEEIKRQITPDRVRGEIDRINKMELPVSLRNWMTGYWKVGGERNEFIWKWIFIISQIITLFSTEKKYRKSLFEIKFLLIMFVVLIDDVADKYKNEKMLKELLKIPYDRSRINFRNINAKEKEYIDFVIKIWLHVENTYQNYPRYPEFEKIIDFDIKQLLNAMEYAYLINQDHYLINSEEYKAYFSHNMQLIIDIMLDLCCSPKFDKQELGLVRDISIYAQQMARIGNWISTWEREIGEGDFTSCVFAYALENKVILFDELQKKNKSELVRKINKAKIEEKFLEEWEDNYRKIKKMEKKVLSINVNDFLVFLEKVIFSHLTSRGYK